MAKTTGNITVNINLAPEAQKIIKEFTKTAAQFIASALQTEPEQEASLGFEDKIRTGDRFIRNPYSERGPRAEIIVVNTDGGLISSARTDGLATSITCTKEKEFREICIRGRWAL